MAFAGFEIIAGPGQHLPEEDAFEDFDIADVKVSEDAAQDSKSSMQPGSDSHGQVTSEHGSDRGGGGSGNAAPAETDSRPAGKTRPGNRERQEARSIREGSARSIRVSAYCPISAAHVRGVLASRAAHLLTAAVIVLTSASIFYRFRWKVDVDEQPAGRIMTEHSERQLKGNTLGNATDVSVASLQDKLQFSRMNMDFDTQVFTAKRKDVAAIINSVCDLPEQICKSMATAASAVDVKYHKKKSVPLDDNKGSYVAAWMWMKPALGDDMVQVAYKAAALSYSLRDVVTYRDQVDEEPDVRCSKRTEEGWFSSTSHEECKQIGTRRTVTPIPVFNQAVMNPQEMALVETMMEHMLAQKVLDGHGRAQAIEAGADEQSIGSEL